jgi:hypothetical protein
LYAAGQPARPIDNPPQITNLPRIAESRKLCWPFSGIVPAAESWPINNRPQVANLPHKFVATREETKM